MTPALIEADACLSNLYALCREHPPIGERPRRLRWLLYDVQYAALARAYGLGLAGAEAAGWHETSPCSAAYLAGCDARALSRSMAA